MTKRNEGEPLSIPEKPYGGHLAGRRWFVEHYEIQRSIMGGYSVAQLRTIVGRIEERSGPTTSNQEAKDQAAKNALISRSRELGINPFKK